MRGCTINGCDRKHYGLGLCSLHYQRNFKHGDPEGRAPTHMDWLIEAVNRDTAECIDWPFGKTNGYGVIRVAGRTTGAHRHACEMAHGPAPEGHEAAHGCGRRACVNPAHLRWATPTENQADRLGHGTHNRGERCGIHKLTEAEVREIRTLVAAGHRQRALAARFGVSQVTISNVINRVSWAWLDAEAAA